MKWSSFSSVACFAIGYLHTKHKTAIGYLLTNCIWRGLGSWGLKARRSPHPWGLWPTNPKNGGAPPPSYVHGDTLRSSNVFVTSTPFAAFTGGRKRRQKIILSHSPRLRLAPHIYSISYLIKNPLVWSQEVDTTLCFTKLNRWMVMNLAILWYDAGMGAITPWAVLPHKMLTFLNAKKIYMLCFLTIFYFSIWANCL